MPPLPFDSTPFDLRAPLSRRKFLHHSATAALATQLPRLPAQVPASRSDSFRSEWESAHDRIWVGAEYWAHPLQDWRVQGGRVESIGAGRNRQLQLMTHPVAAGAGEFSVAVRLGRTDGAALGQGGSAGFRVGIQSALPDFRHALIEGRGLDAGLDESGGLFIQIPTETTDHRLPDELRAAELRLTGKTSGAMCQLVLSAWDEAGHKLGEVSREVDAAEVVGGVALVSNFGPTRGGGGRGSAASAAREWSTATFWFADWRVSGPKVEHRPERTFGPILFSQYTLSEGGLKLSAQLPPLGARDVNPVRLELAGANGWEPILESEIDPEARLALFRIDGWRHSERDVDYRLVYDLARRDGSSAMHTWTGTIRRDPVDQDEIVVADISCNTHAAFPNGELLASVEALKPDVLAFVGDQFYESSGGFGIVRAPIEQATVDYLRKWYLHGWTWRDLTKNRPSLSLPDDHDVYQGNLWGEGGAAGVSSQESGGFDMAAAWVNMVYRTQTAHHPDPAEPRPGANGVVNWYGFFNYGRLGFAVLADRQYKSGPEGKVPPTGTVRADHVQDPRFDPATADAPGLALLGDAQEAFLEEWSRDWRGVDMKIVVSQTIFTAMATTHGTGRMVLRADYDANGWPQTPRRRAVTAMRRAGAFHLAGDQHLPALVQYGIDGPRDGPVAFAGPAVNVGYPRWWEPGKAPWTQAQTASPTGDFVDGFGNPLTVMAVANGLEQPRRGDIMRYLNDKVSGFGIVRFNKSALTATIECWPLLADPLQAGTQFPGWPVVVDMERPHAAAAKAYLPPVRIHGVTRPVLEVVAANTGETIYALRINGPEFQPYVFAPGRYHVRVRDSETGRKIEQRDVLASTTGDTIAPVDLYV